MIDPLNAASSWPRCWPRSFSLVSAFRQTKLVVDGYTDIEPIGPGLRREATPLDNAARMKR
jgi:hypothetical protein